MRYMLDTSICIYIIRERPVQTLGHFRSVNINDIAISSITFAELEYGVEKSAHVERNRIALAMFTSSLSILPFDQNAALEYGRIRTLLEKRGQIIGANDLLIGAHALSERLILVTNNVREFSRIPRLIIENWA